jgi:hypothetical protein
MSDGFYTPDPADVPRYSRWPWVIVALGAGVIVAGGVVFSGSAAGSSPNGTSATRTVGSDSAAKP